MTLELSAKTCSEKVFYIFLQKAPHFLENGAFSYLGEGISRTLVNLESEHFQNLRHIQNNVKIATSNRFHNILRLFNVLPNFHFTIIETKRNY